MKKVILLFAAIMMASTGLWAQKTVKYIDADGQEKTVDAIEVEGDNAVTWGTANTTTWYVVTNDVTLYEGAICVGNVNLILADDKKLSATTAEGQAAIQVSGEGNSLTIYGQVNQTGQLEAICEFGGAAGIGGGSRSSGSNITINGGMITAIADENNASAIGNGSGAETPASNIKVSTKLIVKAGTDEEHAEAIATTRSDDTDIASELKEKHYVSIKSIRTATCTYIDENGESQEVVATEVESSYTPVTWNGGWYVVDDANVLHKGAICQGDVRLILADGAKLTTTGYWNDDEDMGYAGIQVSGEGNSLTIYGQAAQTGQLEANGEGSAAGIGGKMGDAGSNITINGGVVTANASDAAGIGGGDRGAGFNITINRGNVTANSNKGAGIGGGYRASGSNITINGGMITATSNWGAGIGGGYMGSGSNSNICVATTLLVKADNNNPPTEEIEHDGGCDIAEKLKDRRYVTIDSILPFRNAAIATIYAVGKDYNNEIIKAIAETAKTDIEAATTTNAINSIKEKALADLQYALALYDAGKTEVLGTLGEKQTGPAIEVTDQNDNSVILYNPKKVNFIKVETEE